MSLALPALRNLDIVACCIHFTCHMPAAMLINYDLHKDFTTVVQLPKAHRAKANLDHDKKNMLTIEILLNKKAYSLKKSKGCNY